MLDALGLTSQQEAVYRAMLTSPDLTVKGLAQAVGTGEDVVRAALDHLADLALIWLDSDRTARPVRHQAGLMALLNKAEAELVTRRLQLDTTRMAITAIAQAHMTKAPHELANRLDGVDEVRDRLTELAAEAKTECLSFSTGGKQSSDAIAAERPLNEVALARGVTIRNVYLDSFRNDPATVAYAEWMAEHGGLSRTVATLPMRMIIVDRAVAIVPVNPDNSRLGALEVTSPGLVAGLHALFENVWNSGTPFGEIVLRDGNGLDAQERELLRLYAAGLTDESAARKLGVSVRSVQRIMTSLTERLGTASRFQTAVEATVRGWIGSHRGRS
jgi:DNA-binding CsgD family transcriptional regulator/sugar-specific transcriptional regulator TrmB